LGRGGTAPISIKNKREKEGGIRVPEAGTHPSHLEGTSTICWRKVLKRGRKKGGRGDRNRGGASEGGERFCKEKAVDGGSGGGRKDFTCSGHHLAFGKVVSFIKKRDSPDIPGGKGE